MTLQKTLSQWLKKNKNTGRWHVDLTHKGARHRKIFKTKAEASQYLKNALHVPENPSPKLTSEKVSSPVTLRKAYDKAFEIYWSGTKSEETYFKNRVHLFEFFGEDIQLQEITTKEVFEFQQWLKEEKDNSDGTINRKSSLLSMILKLQIRLGNLDSLPFIQRKRESRGRTYFFSEEEERVLLRTAKDNDIVIFEIATVLFNTGMRMGELLSLTPQNIISNPKGYFIHLWETKAGTERYIPMNQKAQPILLSRAEKCFKDTDNLFMYSYDHLRRRYQIIRELAGINENYGLHTMRHTFGTRLGGSTKTPIVQLKELMGHSNLSTTMRYVHVGTQGADLSGLHSELVVDA